jgi:hypothetical protein
LYEDLPWQRLNPGGGVRPGTADLEKRSCSNTTELRMIGILCTNHYRKSILQIDIVKAQTGHGKQNNDIYTIRNQGKGKTHLDLQHNLSYNLDNHRLL